MVLVGQDGAQLAFRQPAQRAGGHVDPGVQPSGAERQRRGDVDHADRGMVRQRTGDGQGTHEAAARANLPPRPRRLTNKTATPNAASAKRATAAALAAGYVKRAMPTSSRCAAPGATCILLTPAASPSAQPARPAPATVIPYRP